MTRTSSNSEGRISSPASLLFLLYHEVRIDHSEYSYVIGCDSFQKHVDLFVRLRRSSAVCPELTFDDGHLSNLELAAPILQSRNLTARFFITVGWTGVKPGFMGWPELRSLHESGQSIGAHGWTHTLLTHLNDQDLAAELNNSRMTLEDKLGTSITTMSLPGGRYDRRVLAACEKAGYTQVYTSIPRLESLPLGPTVGRLNILSSMNSDWIETLFQLDSIALSSLHRRYRLKEAAKSMLGDGLYEKLWALVNRQETEADGEQERFG
jgi:hypothetical protein